MTHTIESPVIVQPGQRVITSGGIVATVAFVSPRGVVHAIGPCDRLPRPVAVRGDAWGGEPDQAEGLHAMAA